MTYRVFVMNGEGGYYWPEPVKWYLSNSSQSLVGFPLNVCGFPNPILIQRDNVLVVAERIPLAQRV